MLMKNISMAVLFLLFFCSLGHAVAIQNVDYKWVSMDTNYDVDRSGAINIGDKIRFTITLTPQGVYPANDIAKVSIGTIYADIQLFNNGTHGDTNANDNVFTAEWTVKEDTSVYNAPITGEYWDAAGNYYTMVSPRTITFDAERPVVNNINVSPNAFNPYTENCQIVYTMSEQVYHVTVIIYSNFSLTGKIKELPRAPDEAGDNFITWWDGKNESGNYVQTPPDGNYYMCVKCKDLSGNANQSPAATIKISTLKIEIVSFDATPTPVSPDGDLVNDWVTVTVRFLLYSWDGRTKSSITTNQMKNLDLRGGLNWSLNSVYSNGNLLHYWPYVKTGFIIYNASGGKLAEYGQDLDPDVDSDVYFLDIFKSQLGSNVCSDGVKDNDWDTLRPFYDDGLGAGRHEIDYGGGASEYHDGIYSAEDDFIMKLAGNWQNGVYIIRSQAELTSIEEETAIVQDQTSIYKVVHFRPDTKGGFVTSDPAQCTFVVDLGDVNVVDFTPPHIIAVSPDDNSIVKYRVSSVSAYLEDNVNGSGVDLSKSDIYLTDAAGNKLPGRKINNGVNVISWQLDTPLKINAIYYIYVIPVDKRGNQVTQSLKYSFTLAVAEENLNMITVNNGGQVLDGAGLVYMRVPPYAVEQDMYITVFKPFSFPGGLQVYNGCQFLPSAVSFKRPVEIILHYGDADKAKMSSDGITEGSIRIYNWKEDSWKYIGGNIDMDHMTVTVNGPREINGFYGLLPESTGGLPEDILSDIQVDKPFKKGGYISFKVSGSVTDLKLMIYDMAGSFVKELSQQNGLITPANAAGYYALNWDLTMNNSQTVNNGIYIFRFIAEKAGGGKTIVSKAIPVIK